MLWLLAITVVTNVITYLTYDHSNKLIKRLRQSNPHPHILTMMMVLSELGVGQPYFLCLIVVFSRGRIYEYNYLSIVFN